MFDRYIKITAIALLLAVVTGFMTNPGSWNYFKFRIGNFDINGETAAIKDSIKLFSSTIAGFYASGGNPAGLNMFPAEMMIKRRIFMDINFNQKAGLVLVQDRDRSDVRQITLIDPVHATALVDEVWFNQYQNSETRRPVSDKKANIITVRYFLKKMWGRWIIVEYEVFGREDRIPPAPAERFINW